MFRPSGCSFSILIFLSVLSSCSSQFNFSSYSILWTFHHSLFLSLPFHPAIHSLLFGLQLLNYLYSSLISEAVPTQNFRRKTSGDKNVRGTKRPEGRNVWRKNVQRDKSSGGTKRPEKNVHGTKYSWGQNFLRD